MSPEEIKELIENKFDATLQEVGASADTLNLALAWQVFKAFSHTQIEQTHGSLLFECGPVNWGEGDFFEVSFLRFFYLEVDEGWDDLMVLMTISFAQVPELNQFTISVSADVDAKSSPAAFVQEVDAHQDFWRTVPKYTVHHSAIEIGSQ